MAEPVGRSHPAKTRVAKLQRSYRLSALDVVSASSWCKLRARVGRACSPRFVRRGKSRRGINGPPDLILARAVVSDGPFGRDRRCIFVVQGYETSSLPRVARVRPSTEELGTGHDGRSLPVPPGSEGLEALINSTEMDRYTVTFCLTPRAKELLRPDEVLVFEWHRLAVCCAGRGRRASR